MAKFYVVWKGHKPGIYDTWAECQKMTNGFSGANFKSFPSKEEANKAFNIRKIKDELKKVSPFLKNADNSFNPLLNNEIEYNSISVDGACSGNPGLGEFQCVDTKTGEQIFIESNFEDTTNNIMEFLALVKALKHLKEKKDDRPIYSDSITAIAWVRNKKCKSTLKETSKNFDSLKSMEEAEIWLRKNEITTEILKWNTKEWGEIPADFGRK